MEKVELKRLFDKTYSKGEARAFTGPARVNLIGEHTDYNGGYVFPCALEMRSMCLVRPRADNIINLASTSYPGMVSADTRHLVDYKKLEWGAYQLGVACMMQQDGYHITGCDMLFDETVPHGSGLSSSAAIEMATAMAFATLDNETTGKPIDKVKLALLGQKAENKYVGMNTGIMDQFASAMGKKGYAILLRCSDLDFSYVPFDIEKQGYTLVITSTNKPRSLITSKYNERRAECERALHDIQKAIPEIMHLAQLSEGLFEEYKGMIENDTDRKRAEHVVYENARTIQSVDLLKKGDIDGFGRLMCQSHESLRDLYEVTGPELDALYEIGLKAPGVIGTRMTGAGFGGCTVSIIQEDNVENFKSRIRKEYPPRTGLEPQFYITKPADGMREEGIDAV